MAGMTPELADAIRASAARLGADPVDLATIASYETGGKLDPWQKGPTTQWGEHRGLFQFGEPQRAKYGFTETSTIPEQMTAIEGYLRDRGYKPGMSLMDTYSIVNAGAPGRYNASDAHNGGAPGTVADKVNTQMADHRAKVMPFFGGPVGVLGNPPAGAQPVAAVGPAGAASPGQPLSLVPAVQSQPTLGDSLKNIGATLSGPEQAAQAKPAESPFVLRPISEGMDLGNTSQQAMMLALALMKKPGGFV